jgi:hypothetical protein
VRWWNIKSSRQIQSNGKIKWYTGEGVDRALTLLKCDIHWYSLFSCYMPCLWTSKFGHFTNLIYHTHNRCTHIHNIIHMGRKLNPEYLSHVPIILICEFTEATICKFKWIYIDTQYRNKYIYMLGLIPHPNWGLVTKITGLCKTHMDYIIWWEKL